MTPAPLTPIPTPLPHRLRELRLRYSPVLVIGLCVTIIVALWRENISAPQFTGQTEPVLANLASHKPGMVAMLNTARFQRVKAGEILGEVLVADPKAVEAALDVIRAELNAIKADLSPLVQQQRNAINFAQLRLDWMRERADLASVRVNLQLAEAEFRRQDQLFKDKLISENEWDISRATRDGYQKQVDELEKLVAEGEINFALIQPEGSDPLMHLTADPMRAAIAAQEAKLKSAEAEFAPVLLRAPMNGVVCAIFHRSGESVTAGEAVLAIASETPARIVGYLRPPNLDAAKAGMKVRVRARSPRRETALALVSGVGAQLETPPLALALPMSPGADLALPVEITVPSELKLRCGELVDLSFSAE